MIGSIAFNPTVVAISDNRINITPNQSGASKDSSYVLLSGQNIDTVKFIDGASKNGQLIYLQGTQTQIHTVRAATIPSISLISGLVTVTVVTTTDHNLTTGDKINILGTNNFNINDVDVTVIDPTTFTYSAIGNVLSESSGTVQDGNFITETGDDVILNGTISPHGTGIIPIIFDPTIVGNGAWRPAQTLTAATGGGGDLSEPLELGFNEVVTQTPPTKTIVAGDIFNPSHINLDQDIDIQLDVSATTGKYKSIFIIFDTTGGGFSVTWPTSVVNPPTIKDSVAERISVLLYTLDNGTLWTHATSVGSSSVGLQNLSELTIDVNKDWQALGISNVGPLTGVTTMAMTGASADITGVNQMTMSGTLPKIQGIEEIDFDGSSSQIQGLANLNFFQTEQAINSLPAGLFYVTAELQKHSFVIGGDEVAKFEEAAANVFRLDMLDHSIINAKDISFDVNASYSVSGAVPAIGYDNANSRLLINLPASGNLFVTNNNIISATQINNSSITTDIINANDLLQLGVTVTPPAFPGEFRSDGTDVFVFSGGSVRSFSDIIPDAMKNDLSNMTSPTLPTVDLSLNTHQLTGVTNVVMTGATPKIDFPNNAIDFISADSSGFIYSISANKKHDFHINGGSVFKINQSAAVITIDAAGNNMVNIQSLRSNTLDLPDSGFIRMASADQIRMRNVGNTDDVFISSGNDAFSNDAIIFSTEGTTVLTVSLLNLDVKDTNIVGTGDIFPRGKVHTIGDETDHFSKMHAFNFIPEASNVDNGIYSLAKFGNTLYVNYDDVNADAGFGIYEQGIRNFLFSNPSVNVHELFIGPDPFNLGETYRIQMGENSTSSAKIELTEGGNDLIIDRQGVATTRSIDLRTGGITRFITNNVESKFFSNVNVNSQNIDGVKSVFADASGLGTIGEFTPSNGGFNYILRDRMSWESNTDTYIEMNVNTLSVVSDADIAISAVTTNSDIDINIGISGTMNLGITATTFLQIASGVMSFSGGNIFLVNGAKYIGFLDATSGDTLDIPSAGDINLFNDSATGELSVKKPGGQVISLEGAGNLNTDLSNMTSPTLPTVDLSLNTHQLTGVTNIIMGGVNSEIDDVGLITFNVGAVQNLDQIFSSIGGQGITFETNQTVFFVPADKKFEFIIGGINSMEIRDIGAGVIEIDMEGNTALGFKDIRFDNTATFTAGTFTAIGSNSDGMILNVPTNDDYNFRVNNSNILTMDETSLAISSSTTSINSATINFGDTDTDKINFIAEIQIAPVYLDGIKQTFNPNGVNAGLNVGSQPNPEPTSPVNGDIYYNSTLNKYRVRENNTWEEIVGANQRLDNLNGTPTLNLNVLANRSTGGKLGANTVQDAFLNVFTDNVTFPNNATSVVAANMGISKFSDVMVINVPTASEIIFANNGGSKVTINSTDLDVLVELNVFAHNINFVGGGEITGLDDILFSNNYFISTGASSLVIDSLNVADIVNWRQGGENRLTFDNVGSVELSGGPTGATRMSVNNGAFTVFAAANGGDTEFICQSGTSLVFKGGATEVARYDESTEDWIFNPPDDVIVEPFVNILLEPETGDLIFNPDIGRIRAFTDIEFVGAGTTFDFDSGTSVPTGSASTAIQIKIAGVVKKIKVYDP